MNQLLQDVDLDFATAPGAWLVQLALKDGGVDPLGLRQINLDLMDRAIPGINNTTVFIDQRLHGLGVVQDQRFTIERRQERYRFLCGKGLRYAPRGDLRLVAYAGWRTRPAWDGGIEVACRWRAEGHSRSRARLGKA